MFTYNNATMQRKIYKYRMRSNYVNYKRLFFSLDFHGRVTIHVEACDGRTYIRPACMAKTISSRYALEVKDRNVLLGIHPIDSINCSRIYTNNNLSYR